MNCRGRASLGAITSISMLNLFKLIGFRLSLETVIIGHATASPKPEINAVGTLIIAASPVLIVLSVPLLKAEDER